MGYWTEVPGPKTYKSAGVYVLLKGSIRVLFTGSIRVP